MVLGLRAPVPGISVRVALARFCLQIASFHRWLRFRAVAPSFRLGRLIGSGTSCQTSILARGARFLLAGRPGRSAEVDVPSSALPPLHKPIQVPIEDLTGHFSALVQVDEVLEEEGDELLTLRAIRGASPGKTERDGIVGGAQALIASANELGVPLTRDDVVMPAPLMLLRPIAIWR